MTLTLRGIEEGRDSLVWSESLDLEIARNPDADRRDRLADVARLATVYIGADEPVSTRAHALIGIGFRTYDALHLACAEAAGVTVFLTVDDQLLRCAQRNEGSLRLRVANPLNWVTEAR